MGATDGVEVEIDSPDAQQNSKVLFEARIRIENPVAEEKDYVKGQKNNQTNCCPKKKNAYAEEAEIERKHQKKIGRCESTKLSALASRFDTSFHWCFLRLSCSWLAALRADWLGTAAR